jgi:predicted permease
MAVILDKMVAIFVQVLLPVLVMVGLGSLLQWRIPMQVQTLVRLNLYLFVPAFLFVRIGDSDLPWSQIISMAAAVFGPMILLGVPLYFMLRRARVSGQTIAAVVVGGLFYNAGNFGIPVAELAFGRDGGQVQALVVMYLNTSIFFLGYMIYALSKGEGWKPALGYFKLPMFYAITAGFIVRDAEIAVPKFVDEAARIVANGMVPIALITLGAQLVLQARRPNWRLITPVVLLKLLAMPAATAVVVYLLGLWPWPGAQLVLAAAAPTAVNTLLLTLELDGDAETAAQCVFWTTLLCVVTVTLTLAAVLAAGGGPPGSVIAL